MQIKIHRGIDQIDGNITEIATSKAKIAINSTTCEEVEIVI